jgi:hypothetical protein
VVSRALYMRGVAISDSGTQTSKAATIRGSSGAVGWRANLVGRGASLRVVGRLRSALLVMLFLAGGYG